MQVSLQDRAPLSKVRRLADGRIAATARFARSGVYSYTGAQVGRPDLQTVNVYRDAREVFDEAAMASFAHRAITLDHPAESVTADNWRQVSVGYTEGKVVRDGEFVEIPLMLADASAVAAYDTGKARELSAGYSCDLIFQDGIAPDGTPYQAVQRAIRGNHIALVPAGRAGSECRIGDSAVTMLTDEQTFADSAEGQYAVAQAKLSHTRRQRYKAEDQMTPWTDAHALEAIRTAIRNRSGAAVRDAAYAHQYFR
jgi:hypothetical protein